MPALRSRPRPVKNLSRSRAQLTMQESSEQEERFCSFERLRSLALWEATGGTDFLDLVAINL